MSYKFEEGKAVIIDALIERFKQHSQDDQVACCMAFVRQFFGTVALEDLQNWAIEDIYGAAVHFWTLIQHRKPDEIKLRIYNPVFEQHGWQTTHTVIELICKDMSFLVDTIRMVTNRMGIAMHLIIHMGGLRLIRDAKGNVSQILPRLGDSVAGEIIEGPIFVEIDRQTDPLVLKQLQDNLEQALEDNHLVADDWFAMREQVKSMLIELDQAPLTLNSAEVAEAKAFLNWIEDHHFTFLGVRDYKLTQKKGETLLEAIPETGYGILRDSVSKPQVRNISAMPPEARELTTSPHVLVMSKTHNLATVHRDAYTDYIGIKRFNAKGDVIGERRLIGLYTSAAYNTNPKHIPFLRHKVASIIQKSSLNPQSHAGRVLLNILDTLPRDELIQGSIDDLLEIAMGIFYMQERHRIRLFARMDVYHRFVSCLVYVPKDRFDAELREAMQAILAQSFQSESITFTTFFSESVLARIHYMVRLDSKAAHSYDFKEIEKKLIEVARSWKDDLQYFLAESFGEERANQLFEQYKHAFPAGYISNFSPRIAVLDIKHMDTLSDDAPLGMNFYRPVDEFSDNFRLKLYQKDVTIPISDVLPIIEHLGLRAISERPFSLQLSDKSITWINEFFMYYPQGSQLALDDIKELFQAAFISIWRKRAEDDGFNKLVLAAGLDWRQVSVLRMYAKYFKQIGFTFSQEYIETALNKNPLIAKKIVRLFELRFDPFDITNRDAEYETVCSAIVADLEAVSNLDEDKIIRHYIHAITATLRTNYYQTDSGGNSKNYISIKLDSRAVPGLPKPHPLYEIFVYSPRFEGIHLRGGKVARGGLRWSDRREDFRTEVLGLMKAQQVKNAVIVPSGAKGGFVLKQLPPNSTREETMNEGVACYQQFISGLLDITDNYKEGLVCKPQSTISYDEDDTYLVVAADKGTATFSDYANAISLAYDFWLGDAFASGGSVGYDHKKIGITARGAWESVKRHFHDRGIDTQTTDFTVVGIGDMAGDVFGNGMLLSPHIKLVAAFNHVHIFIDPTPNPEQSFYERKRLFELPRSNWTDYDPTLISKGGGVFNRNAKSIAVTEEMKACFGIKQAEIEPNELIKLLLRAKVDLLWSAGIGTFVKAQSQTHADVGDRTNDAIRINAKQLRCKVVGEGGNLGLTQLARIEFALNGGLIYTDFIDNSGGVSCSDKEVNIKILLDLIVAAGDLTLKQRNELLVDMTDEVADLVLRENYMQTRAINLMAIQAFRSVGLHTRYMRELDRAGKLDRKIEYLPDEKSLLERRLLEQGLTTPEIAVLLCYSKITLKEAVLSTDVPEDPYLKHLLIASFPKPLQDRFTKQMDLHPLKREIIATKLSNMVVNEVGFAFVYRLQDETGAPISAILRAYMVARTILNMEEIWNQIDALDSKIDNQKQADMMLIYLRLLRRITRWFLRSQRTKLNIAETVKRLSSGIREFKQAMPDILSEKNRAQFDEFYTQYIEMGVSPFLAHELTLSRGLFSVLDMIEIAHTLQMTVTAVADVYFRLGEFLDLGWLRSQVIIHPTENHWEVLSRESLRDDLDAQQRQLTAAILADADLTKENDIGICLTAWADRHSFLIARWMKVLANLRSAGTLTYTMLFVATRELLDLTQTTRQLSVQNAVKEPTGC